MRGTLLKRAGSLNYSPHCCGPSWACAIYFFGPLSLPAHFWVTRRTLLGFLQGTAWTIAVFGSEYLLGLGLESAFGES